MEDSEIRREFSDNMQLNISDTSSPKKKASPKKTTSKRKDSNRRSKKNTRISKEIEIKQNKKMKVLKSPVRSGKKRRSPETHKSQEDSPIKDESSKGHHEMVSLLSNPNMLFNDASSIKYSVDNQNMSNISLPSLAVEGTKAGFDSLDGMCYDLI